MKKLLYPVFLLLISISISAQRAQDSLALVKLFYSTGGPNWITKTNWLGPEPISAWYGVTIENNRISSIDLDQNNLTGMIPHEIGYLTSLTDLYLSNNNLSGSIPKEIGYMKYLEELDLSNNKLSGNIPGRIYKLRYFDLDLSNNQLKGPVITYEASLGEYDLPKIYYYKGKIALKNSIKYNAKKIYINSDSITFKNDLTGLGKSIMLSKIDYIQVQEGTHTLLFCAFGAMIAGLGSLDGIVNDQSIQHPLMYIADFTISGAIIGGLIGLATPKWRSYSNK